MEEQNIIRPCERCGQEIATERHHKFSQTKLNRKLYPEFIDDPANIQYLCYDCHHNKPVDKYTEKEFCELLGIEPRSKSGAQKFGKIREIEKQIELDNDFKSALNELTSEIGKEKSCKMRGFNFNSK